jgi:hypothetical protein
VLDIRDIIFLIFKISLTLGDAKWAPVSHLALAPDQERDLAILTLRLALLKRLQVPNPHKSHRRKWETC